MIRSISSLAVTLALWLMGAHCTQNPPVKAESLASSNPASAKSPASAPASSGTPAPREVPETPEEIPPIEDFADEAESEITPSNYKQELKDLEKTLR